MTLGELDTLVRDLAPPAAGAAPTRGFTLPQALAHCAQSIEYSLTGYPALRSRLFRATIGPVVKRRFMRAGRMSHDRAAPVPGAPALSGDLALEDARARLHAAIAAFRSHPGTFAPHLAYGACSREDYAVLHVLHVEDHLREFSALA